MKRIAVIGAGAAGCFCAAELRRLRPEFRVDVYEAGPKPLTKVAITGGGRCNLTNSFEGIRSLSEAYPRGERLMKRLLKQFSQEDTWRWFESAGVPLVLQEDHCVFPRSQDAMDIVHALLRRMEGANLLLRTPVHRIETPDQVGGDEALIPGLTRNLLVDGAPYDAVVVTTGGAPKELPMLDGLELEWVPTVPSLFTFTIRDEGLRSLMGLVVDASVSLPGTAFKADGPLLITDWGLSGPAVLKLSSYAARFLHEAGYQAPLSVNWLGLNEAETREILQETATGNPRKQVSNTPVAGLQGRLWNHLIVKAGLRADIRWEANAIPDCTSPVKSWTSTPSPADSTCRRPGPPALPSPVRLPQNERNPPHRRPCRPRPPRHRHPGHLAHREDAFAECAPRKRGPGP